jgi:hypothetical protein
MNADLVKLYKDLDKLEQTKEVTQIKSDIKDTLYRDLRTSMLDTVSLGSVIGFEQLESEMLKVIELIRMQNA